MKNKLIICTAFVSSLLFIVTNTFAEVAIIANTKSMGSLDAKSAKKLFLGKTKSIPGIDNVTLIGQIDSNPIKAEFTKKATRKKIGKYKAHWSRMTFSGKAVPPKELASDAEVKEYVAKHADAVGYINAAAVDDSVKVLLRLP